MDSIGDIEENNKLSHSLLPAHLNKCLLCCGNCLFFFSFACVRLEKRFLCSKKSVTISFQLQKLSHTGYFTIGNNKCLLPCSFLTEYSRTIFFYFYFFLFLANNLEATVYPHLESNHIHYFSKME